LKNYAFAILTTAFVLQALVAADSRPARWTAPNAEQAETLGRCRFDGSLLYAFDLGVVDLGGGLRIPLRLIHELEVSSERKARSVWRVSGLQSFIVPDDRTRLLWMSPQMGRVEIQRKLVGSALTLVGRGAWMIRELGPGDWDLKDGDGGVWSYRKGALTGIATGLGFGVRVTSHGGRIDSFRVERGGELLHAVSADYDALGRLIEITNDGVIHRFSYDGGTEAMNEWSEQKPGRVAAVTRFIYSDGLLTEVQRTGSAIVPLRWAAVANAKRADQLWPVPVQLAEDDRFMFEHQLRQEGFVLIAHPKSGGPPEEAVFNPRRGRIVRRLAGKTTEVMMIGIRVGRSDYLRVIAVEDGSGHVLQSLFYGEGGRLERIEFPQEPGGLPVLFTYDLQGRMMGATRGDKPWHPERETANPSGNPLTGKPTRP
jgi:hypothetical protein